jgi:hypothetical protein
MCLAHITQDRLAYKREWSTEKCEKARVFASPQALDTYVVEMPNAEC